MQVQNRAIKLSLEATREIMTAPRRTIAYKFLAKDGTFMREATQSDGADVYDVCVADWARAVQVAHEIGAEFIAKLHQHTVCHRNVTPYGNTIWTETVVYPHESFFKEWDGSIYTPFEPGIKAERPSGAAQRNRRKQQGLDEKERT